MDRQQLIEILKANVESAQRHNLDWLPVPLAAAEAVLQRLYAVNWIVEAEVSIISHKHGISMGAYITDGEPKANLLIFKEVSDAEIMVALSETLDGAKVVIDALVEKVMGVVEERWANP